MLCLGWTADAATMISETEKGRVTGQFTIDTLGIFGPAGADLSGKPITVYTQYVPADFGPVQDCYHAAYCTFATSQGLPQTPRAVLILISVNGVRRTFNSTAFGEVLFDKSSLNLLELYTNTQMTPPGTFGLRLATSFTSPVTFGSPLSPENAPVLGTSVDTIEFFVPNNQLPGETLSFALTSAH